MASSSQIAVIGGGMIGAAIAYGLARLGRNVVMLDGGDRDQRAARGNFGLIWVQGKGDGCPAYAGLTRRSAELWPEFDAELRDASGIDTGYARPGGIHICLGPEELRQRAEKLRRMETTAEGAGYEILDRDGALDAMPGLGPDVAGGSYCPLDGHVNPLRLLRALHTGFLRLGGRLISEPVTDLRGHDGGFSMSVPSGSLRSEAVVVAAGLGSRELGASVGLNLPVRPERGQILVTARTAPFLTLPTIQVRQTCEGTVLLGDSHEDTGLDDGTTIRTMSEIAARACRLFPALARLRVVRAWGALRVLTPDGRPVYDQAAAHPGAFSATAHSGVTLAAAHALDLAGQIASGGWSDALSPLGERMFHVQ